jgi:DNA polymerase epsilon subunit 1
MEALQDMREYDVPYHVRFAIDCDIRCGHWFTVRCTVSHSTQQERGNWVSGQGLPGICRLQLQGQQAAARLT